MVSKCANPSCPTPFHYLREGKLFRIEMNDGQGTVQPHVISRVQKSGMQVISRNRPARGVEHFWLCGRCANVLTVAYDEVQGVVLLPLFKPAHRAAAS